MSDVETDFTELLDRARHLDRYALEEIHDSLYPQVYRYLCFRVQDDSACQELAAQVFERFLNALNKRSGPKDDARAWLIQDAAELATRYQNTHQPKQDSSLLGIIGDKMAHKEQNELPREIGWSRQWVQQAIGQLKPEQQHILALRFAMGRSLEQTAISLGKPVRAARILHWRALEALRKILADKRPA